MRNSSMYRANLSDEKLAFLADIKEQKEAENNKELQGESNEPHAYKRPEKQKEIDLLWQTFKINPKEEKSPGVYLLTGFIAGALSVFIMTSVLGISSKMTAEQSETSLGQPKFEKKISRKSKIPQINTAVSVITGTNAAEKDLPAAAPKVENYTVKQGDSMSSIVYRFYGKYDLSKVEKIKNANNLSSEHKLSVGQQLIIPLD